jgi:16S rRNA (cytosine1402-N4)-methyltransferase
MIYQHTPVLLNECIEGLNIRPDGTYLDGTLGGGGHSSKILQRLGPGGRLFGIDRDRAALEATAERIHDARFQPIHGNFHDTIALLSALGVSSLNGALLDLGVSSPQLDDGARGFSYHEDAALDMRMDRSQALTARTIVNDWPEGEIARILRDYGEENWSRHIARVLCDRRKAKPLETTGDLVSIIDAAIPKKFRAKDGGHPARRSFQALRIAVNDELAPLEAALRNLTALLQPGGRLCVISFHSLEDRVVKTTFRDLANPCVCPPDSPMCVCGKVPVARLVTRKPVSPTEAELSRNARARSANLRILEKLEAAQ